MTNRISAADQLQELRHSGSATPRRRRHARAGMNAVRRRRREADMVEKRRRRGHDVAASQLALWMGHRDQRNADFRSRTRRGLGRRDQRHPEQAPCQDRKRWVSADFGDIGRAAGVPPSTHDCPGCVVSEQATRDMRRRRAYGRPSVDWLSCACNLCTSRGRSCYPIGDEPCHPQDLCARRLGEA